MHATIKAFQLVWKPAADKFYRAPVGDGRDAEAFFSRGCWNWYITGNEQLIEKYGRGYADVESAMLDAEKIAIRGLELTGNQQLLCAHHAGCGRPVAGRAVAAAREVAHV